MVASIDIDVCTSIWTLNRSRFTRKGSYSIPGATDIEKDCVGVRLGEFQRCAVAGTSIANEIVLKPSFRWRQTGAIDIEAWCRTHPRSGALDVQVAITRRRGILGQDGSSKGCTDISQGQEDSKGYQGDNYTLECQSLLLFTFHTLHQLVDLFNVQMSLIFRIELTQLDLGGIEIALVSEVILLADRRETIVRGRWLFRLAHGKLRWRFTGNLLGRDPLLDSFDYELPGSQDTRQQYRDTDSYKSTMEHHESFYDPYRRPHHQDWYEEPETVTRRIPQAPVTAILIAIVVIVLYQFQGTFHAQELACYNLSPYFLAPILYWIDSRKGQSLWESLLDLYWLIFDITRAFLRMLHELLRIQRPFQRYASSMPELEPMEQTPPSPTPPIIITDPSERSVDASPSPVKRRQQWGEPSELEPAFLSDADYPPGWKVYHPILGVVAKSVADRYDRNLQRDDTPDMAVDEQRDEASSRENGHADLVPTATT